MTRHQNGLLRGAAPFLPLAAFLLVLFVLPVATVLALAVWTPEAGWQWPAWQRLASAPVYRAVLWRTLHIGALTTALCLAGALPVALLVHRLAGRAQQWLYLLVLLPLWTSFLVKSFAWMVLLGKNGAVNALITAVTGEPAAMPLLFNLGAVIVGMVHGLMPFAVLTLLPVLQAIDPRLAAAAATLGARPAEAFVRVTLPLLAPGIAAAALMVFVTALGFFIVPALLGGPRQTMAANVIIELVQELLNWPLAAAASTVMLLVVAALFWAYVRAFGIETLVGRARVMASAPAAADGLPHLAGRRAQWRRRAWIAFDALARALPARPLRWGRDTFALAVVAFLALPALFLVPVSFSSSGIVDWPPQFFSTRWYAALDTPAWRSSAWRSLAVAVATGVISLALAYPAAA
jgi:putative spermidine/putrescine transport system permease protein